MNDVSPFLKQLISLPGLSGYESPVRELISDAWRPLVDELSVSKLGSLHGVRYATPKTKSPNILFAAHMDAIGLMVTGITDGFLRVTRIGGIDPRILPGQLLQCTDAATCQALQCFGPIGCSMPVTKVNLRL